MIEDLTPLGITVPGFFANGTKYQGKGRWAGGNFVRFHERTIQPIGGWLHLLTTNVAMVGVPHAAVCWQLADGTPFLAVGTTEGLYVIDNDNVVFDITPDAGDLHAAPFDWHLSTFGAYLSATNSLRGDDDISKVNVYVWTGDTGVVAVPAWTSANGPLGAYVAFATQERFFTVLRGQDPSTHTARSGVDTPYSERRVFFASQETLDEFVSTDTNTGGDFDLQTDGRLVVGVGTRGQSLIWTDIDLWTMTFIGGELVYSFQNVGKECGIVGKRAFAVIDKGTFWMARGKFFMYDGFVKNIPCEVTDHVFGDFNDARAHTVWCFSNSKYNEITWFYPSNGAEWPDRYVTYNHAENHWVFGSLDRTIGVPVRFRQDVIDEKKPFAFAQDGSMYEHETGIEREGLAFLESGPIEIGAGDRLMRIQEVVPDDKALGDVQLRLYLSMAPDALERLVGPYSLSAITTVRHTARQARLRLEEARASDWRVGDVRLGVRPGERRGSGPAPADTEPASLTIIPETIDLINGQHYTIEAVIRNAAGEVLDLEPDVWTSSAPDLISVDDTGTITVLAAPADVTIAATYTPASLTSNDTTVHVASRVATTLALESTLDVEYSLTTPLHPVFRDAFGVIVTDKEVTSYDLGDDTIVSVDLAGDIVSGLLPGSSTIIAHCSDPALTSNTCTATVDAHFKIHRFTSNQNFTVTTGGTVETVLVVGGGGSGASVDGTGVGGGGGGAGGLLQLSDIVVTPQAYPIAVGSGGTAPHADHTLGGGTFGCLPGADGLGSSAFGRTAGGGGGGGGADATFARRGRNGGFEGGSGGGGAAAGDPFPHAGDYDGGTANMPDGIESFGNDGGNGDNTDEVGAGGGGAGGAGQHGGTGTGGVGITLSTTGTAIEYARGGTARDGAGNAVADDHGYGGEGGGRHLLCDGTNGGKGEVIVRYRVSSGIVATGGTITTIVDNTDL